ncbi:MAG TPA: hypothetical protein VKB58_15980 [Terriglobales bacterium]|nr:hypothetical protein [Terriglobales bacterium]
MVRQANAQATAPQARTPQVSGQPVAAAASMPAGRQHSQHKKTAPIAETPAPPPPQPTLEQSPPTAPQVNLQDGQLTIDASNSTLGQVLRAVQSRTGASMEIPAAASNERVVAQLGPGQPRDVLNTLLNGTRFNYVILGVTGDPGAVQKVILTPRQGGATPPVNTAQNVPQPQQDEEQVDEGVPVADTGENEYQNPEPPPVTPGGLRRPMVIQPNGPGYDPGANYGNGEQPVSPKSPEQLMQEMQQLQQQQQMYQQQLNPANQQPQQ